MDRRGGDRGQSVQIGVVVLFGVLVIVFSIYQAFVVPNQNQQIEFNHNQRVQGDMVELRNAVLTTETTGQDGYVTVELGTEFPPRLVALNPPPPTGTLYTTDRRPVVVRERATGADVTTEVCPGSEIRTRFVEYSPDYTEFANPGTIRYENSLVYTAFEDDAVVRLSGQEFVRDGTVRIIPIRRSFNRGGSGTVPVEPKAGPVETSRLTDVNVTVPTGLSERRWEDALAGQVPPGNVSVTDGPGGRNLTVALSGAYRLTCGSVGFGGNPPSGQRGGDPAEINPAAPGDVRLESSTASGSTVTLTFNNTGGTTSFVGGRINFYRSTGGSRTPEYANVTVDDTERASLFVERGYESFSPTIELAGGATTDVTFSFDRGGGGQAWFVTTLELESGETALYFVPAG
jgi:hypothetical protein